MSSLPGTLVSFAWRVECLGLVFSGGWNHRPASSDQWPALFIHCFHIQFKFSSCNRVHPRLMLWDSAVAECYIYYCLSCSGFHVYFRKIFSERTLCCEVHFCTLGLGWVGSEFRCESDFHYKYNQTPGTNPIEFVTSPSATLDLSLCKIVFSSCFYHAPPHPCPRAQSLGLNGLRSQIPPGSVSSVLTSRELRLGSGNGKKT